MRHDTLNESWDMGKLYGQLSDNLQKYNLFARDICDAGSDEPFSFNRNVLRHYFRLFNKCYFAGCISDYYVVDIADMHDCWGKVDGCRILIASDISGHVTKYGLLNTLLHEMTHAFVTSLNLEFGYHNERNGDGSTFHSGLFAWLLRRLQYYGWNFNQSVYTYDNPRIASSIMGIGDMNIDDFIGNEFSNDFRRLLTYGIMGSALRTRYLQYDEQVKVVNFMKTSFPRFITVGVTRSDKDFYGYEFNTSAPSASVMLKLNGCRYDGLMNAARQSILELNGNFGGKSPICRKMVMFFRSGVIDEELAAMISDVLKERMKNKMTYILFSESQKIVFNVRNFVKMSSLERQTSR